MSVDFQINGKAAKANAETDTRLLWTRENDMTHDFSFPWALTNSKQAWMPQASPWPCISRWRLSR